jgi:hypothetical protein
MIALETAGDNIIPCFAAALDDGFDMVKGQVFRVKFFTAILAGVMIPRIDIGSAELDVLQIFADLYILQQSEDTGHPDGKADAVDLAIIFSQNLNFTLVEQV